MNLLMISGDRSLAEGKHGAFYNTLEEFHKYWDRVDIICPRVTSNRQIVNGKRITSYKLPITLFGNVFIHPSPWPLFLQPLWIWWMGRKLITNYKLPITDLVMTVHEYPPFYNGLGAKLLYRTIKVPYILEVMHIPGLPKAGDFKEGIYKWLMKVVIKWDASSAKKIRIINQKQTPDFLVNAGVKKEKLIYIPAFYIDLEVFKPIINYQLPVTKQYDLVFAARLEKNKGIFNLIEAIKIAKQKKPDISLLIIGHGSQLEKLKLLITNYQLQDNVTFSGWLEGPRDVALAYNRARCFVNPSYNEGGPRVVLEAMACGLPVISTPVGLMVDIIKDEDNAMFTWWEPMEMAKKILLLLNDPSMQKKFSSAGIELVKNFEKRDAIKNYADKLKNAVISNS